MMSARSLEDTGVREPFRHDVTRMEIDRIQQEIDDLKKQLGAGGQTERQKEDAGVKVLNIELGTGLDRQKLPDHLIGRAASPREIKMSQHPDNVQSSYNPLDKGMVAPQLPRTNTLPYSRDKAISVHDMTVPRVQSMGVIPIRGTGDIHGLNVLLQGKPALSKDDREITAVQEANEGVSISPAFTSATSAIESELRDLTEISTPQGFSRLRYPPPSKKPAILGSEGTIATVKFSERGPQQRELVSKTQKRKVKSIKSTKKSPPVPDPRQKPSSLRSEDVFGSDGGSYISENTIDISALSNPPTPSGRKIDRMSSSAGSSKSVQELVAEAVDLTSQDSVHSHRRKKSGEDTKKGKKPDKKDQGPRTVNPQERSVDEIIAKLKAAKEGKISQKSEADIKIQEIMGRVMMRAGDTQGTEGEEQIDPEQEVTETVTGGDRVDDLPDVSSSAVGVETGRSQESVQPTPEEDVKQVEEPPQPVIESPTAPQEPDTEMASGVPLGPTKEPLPSHSRVVLQAVKMIGSLPPDEVEKAWRDLMMPREVSYSDVMRVVGTAEPLVEKQTAQRGEMAAREQKGVAVPVQSASVSFLSTWAPSGKPEREKSSHPEEPDSRRSIHHFCTMNPAGLSLPGQLQMATRMHHTPSRHKETGHLGARHNTEVGNGDKSKPDTEKVTPLTSSQIPAEPEAIITDEGLHDWQARAEQMLEVAVLPGHQLPVHQDASRLYWTPAPPKMNLPGSIIGEHLFPEFHGAMVTNTGDTLSTITDVPSEEEADIDLPVSEGEGDRFRARLVVRRCASVGDLTKQTDPGPLAADATVDDSSDGESGRKSAMVPQDELKRSCSAPDLLGEEYILFVESDFDSCMRELLHQQERIERMRHEVPDQGVLQSPDKPETHVQAETSKVDLPSDTPEDVTPTRRRDRSSTLAEKSRAAGLKYVLYPKKKRKKKPLDPRRLENIEAFLKAPARVIERRHSFREVSTEEKEFEMPLNIRLLRRPSLPLELDFDEFMEKHRDSEDPPDEREWVHQIWDDWFEELFAESQAASEVDGGQDESKPVSPTPDKMRSSVLSSADSVNIDVISPLLDNDEDVMMFEELQAEVQRLTDEIDKAANPLPFDIARRGALYRKMGEISRAWEDLNRAIELEPLLLDAYWHRHLLYLLKGKPMKALEDLSAILKMNKEHVGAYKSRAEIFKQQGDITMAISNYTQSIKLMPDDYEAYYKRAEMYEKRVEMLLALEDYREASRLMPGKTEAIFKRGLYQFNNNKNWVAAIKDFTEMLIQEPKNATARTYRGRAFAKQGMYMEAVADLSAGIHLDPSNSVGFYHRGCLLRRANPRQALQDLSISILLDDGRENLMAFFHRGILYEELGGHQDAIRDYENVLQLDKTIAAAHVNIGLIYLNKLSSFYRANPRQALQDLSISILLDDGRENLMAFFHRGILFEELGRHQDAICNFEVVLWLDKTITVADVNIRLIYLNKLSSFYRAIQKFTNAIKVDPTYDRALVCRGEAYNRIHKCREALKDFTSAIHLCPDKQHYYMFRGQVLLKMKNLELASFCVKHASELSQDLGSSPTQQAAVQSFLQNYTAAMDVLRESVKVQPNSPSYILLGRTQIKAKKFKDAVCSLEKALDIMKPWTDRQSWPPEAAEVYYLIGMCHMEIPNYLRAFEAFNSAIRINSEYPEAYYQRGLTRMKLRQSKGILDFNRALSLKPYLFQAYLSRAAYYGMKKRYSKGIFNCNEAVRLQPNSVRAYLYRGALKYYIQAYRLAIMDLSKAIDLDTSCSLAYFNRAVCYHTTGDYPRAQRDYGIVLMLGEEEAIKVLINRGLLYLSQEDYKNAREDFAQAVKVKPRDPKIRHTLGICCHKLDRLQEAVEVYTDALQVDPFFLEAYLGRANTLMDYGHAITVTLARRDCERAIRLEPHCLDAWVGLGYNMQLCGRFKQAWSLFAAALAINPNYQPALEGRAVVCLQMSDTSAALKDMNSALRIGPTAELHTNRGVVHQFMGDTTYAMADYQSAIKINPAYPLAYFNAANLYFLNRQFLQANEFYNKTISLKPNDEAAVLNRAITRVLLRDVKGALEDFQRAASLSPYSAHVFFNRANLYASLSKYQLAEQDYSTALELLPDDPLVYKRRADIRNKLGRRDEAVSDYRQAVNIQSKVLVY